MHKARNRPERPWILISAIIALSLLPILLVSFPPATDLPQHISQIRLFIDALANPSSPYTIQWIGPNNLVYAVIYLLWRVLPVGAVPQATLAILVLSWMGAIFMLAVRKERPMEPAALASMLVFNHALYWGFLNFLVGFPIFVAWFLLTARNRRRANWFYYFLLMLTSILLYAAHALWFAVGAMWLLLTCLLQKKPVKEILLRVASLVPCGLVALLWYPHLASSRATAGFDVGAHWMPLFDRLSFSSFVDGTFGGLRGAVEPFIFLFLYAWIGISIWLWRKRLSSAVEPDLLAAAALFFAIFLFAPDKYMNTIYFASRWLPVGLVFLLLAFPMPSVKKGLTKLVSFSVATTFFLITSLVWFTFEASEATGLRDSLSRISSPSRVLGLDFVKTSQYIKGSPFLQMFAYAQVYAGGELNFSFAEHASGLVAYKMRRSITWTPGLEWYPERVRRSDLSAFDFVLVNGDEPAHRFVLSLGTLSAVTNSGRWRLYRVDTSVAAH